MRVPNLARRDYEQRCVLRRVEKDPGGKVMYSARNHVFRRAKRSFQHIVDQLGGRKVARVGIDRESSLGVVLVDERPRHQYRDRLRCAGAVIHRPAQRHSCRVRSVDSDEDPSHRIQDAATTRRPEPKQDPHPCDARPTSMSRPWPRPRRAVADRRGARTARSVRSASRTRFGRVHRPPRLPLGRRRRRQVSDRHRGTSARHLVLRDQRPDRCDLPPMTVHEGGRAATPAHSRS